MDTTPRFFMIQPPLCLCIKKHAAPSNMKIAPVRPLIPAPRSGWPGTSKIRQSSPISSSLIKVSYTLEPFVGMAGFKFPGFVSEAWKNGTNALCESFFATLECELLQRSSFRTPTEARMAVFDFVEGFYNPHRRHSSLENHSPVSYERRYDQASAVVETADQAMEIAARFPQPLGSRYAAPTVPTTPTVTS